MNTVWFIVLGAMLTAYAILDGYDLGVGALFTWVARTESEKLAARASIGPVWNGNEVWLIAAGGAMFMAFPRLYAASFSGFYLALMIVLWLLIARGIAIEFRHAQDDPLWTSGWDFVFTVASALLAVLFGVALGNVVRGVPLNAAHYFQGSFALLLNWFSLLGGVLSLATLVLHGATFLAMKTEGAIQERARGFASHAWVACAILVVLFALAASRVRPDFIHNFRDDPVLFILPVLVAVSFASVSRFVRLKQDSLLFGSSCLLIFALLGSVGAGLFPRVLPSLGDARFDLTIYNSATSYHGLVTALILNSAGLIGVIAYIYYVSRVWVGKVKIDH